MVRIARHDPAAEKLAQSMDDILAMLEDIHGQLRSRVESYEHDPERTGELEERLNAVRELKRKHRTDEAGLLRLAEEMDTKLLLLDESGQSTAEAKRAVDEALDGYRRAVAEFLDRRKRAALGLCRKINRDLGNLGMPGTDFRVDQIDAGGVGEALVDAGGTAHPRQRSSKENFSYPPMWARTYCRSPGSPRAES